MPARLVALDEGPDIALDRTFVVVGRHPACDTRLDSLRVSRHHCCMTPEGGAVVVRDLGSTNGIRINGQRVEIGRLRPGDELSIAHIRYRLEKGEGREPTIAEPADVAGIVAQAEDRGPAPINLAPASGSPLAALRGPERDDNAWAAADRKCLPPGLAEKGRIQVIVQVAEDSGPKGEPVDPPEAFNREPR